MQGVLISLLRNVEPAPAASPALAGSSHENFKMQINRLESFEKDKFDLVQPKMYAMLERSDRRFTGNNHFSFAFCVARQTDLLLLSQCGVSRR